MASKQLEDLHQEGEDTQSKEFRVIFHSDKMDIIVEDWDSEQQ